MLIRGLPRLSKAKIFTVCDARNGYWQVKLNESSSLLTAMATPFGRYMWKRMPFGVSPAPEIFQEKLDQVIEGLERVFAVFDDILIIGEGDTLAEAETVHDVRFAKLMKRSQEKQLRLHPDKLRFKTTEVPYVGHELTASGVKIDEHKVRAIRDMPAPTSVKEVRRFIGMANFFSRFMPHMANVLQPLHQLTGKNAWDWGPEHDSAINSVKRALSTAPILKYFDKQIPTTLQCDASTYGLGAVLLQEGQPITFASRRLTKAEEGYAQIERELLAIVFGCTKFNQYVFGREFEVQSDHQPLSTIAKRSLSDAPRRLQRMLLQLQRYDMRIEYLPGKSMHVADTLSRAPVHEDFSGQEELAESAQEVLATEIVREGISNPTLDEVRMLTSTDQAMQKLMDVVKNGWPDQQGQIDNEVRPYFHHRDELTIENGILFKGDRCVIPTAMRTGILKKLHATHMGVESTLRRARQLVFWPGLNGQVRDVLSRCDICQATGRAQLKEPLRCHAIPDRPWQVVGTDLFSLGTRNFLILVDYWSGFWELDVLHDTQSATVTVQLRRHFARHGIPERLISDNGPQFSCRHFQQFARLWQFEHITSSRYHPASNGKAESAVKTAKCLIKKAQNDGQDPWLAILAYRNTPTEGMSSSPTERLLGRKARTTLPTKPSLFSDDGKSCKVAQELHAKQQRQERYYNRTSHSLSDLVQGDAVRVQPREGVRHWQAAVVIEMISPRSFAVRLNNGRILRRNRCALRKVKDSHNPGEIEDDAILCPEEETTTKTAETNTGEGTGEPFQTRSGRISRPPTWMKDYVS